MNGVSISNSFPLCSETQANHTYDSGIIYRYILERLHNFFVSVSLHRHSISKFGFEFLMTVFSASSSTFIKVSKTRS